MRIIKVDVCAACSPPDGVRNNSTKLGEGLQQLFLTCPVVQLQFQPEEN